jgi:hypothetical protein
MTGAYDLDAPREAVWEALNDPEVLKQCIPGCETINKTSETEFEATATAKVGPVKAKFKGKVQLSDLDPPNGYTISGEGQGGAAGFAKGGAKVALEEIAPGRTRLSYDVDATVGGKLAQIGQRLVDSAAKKMADDFFKNFAETVGGETAAEVVEEAAPSAMDEASEQLRANQARMRQLTYMGAAAAVLGVIWLLFGQ